MLVVSVVWIDESLKVCLPALVFVCLLFFVSNFLLGVPCVFVCWRFLVCLKLKSSLKTEQRGANTLGIRSCTHPCVHLVVFQFIMHSISACRNASPQIYLHSASTPSCLHAVIPFHERLAASKTLSNLFFFFQLYSVCYSSGKKGYLEGWLGRGLNEVSAGDSKGVVLL